MSVSRFLSLGVARPLRLLVGLCLRTLFLTILSYAKDAYHLVDIKTSNQTLSSSYESSPDIQRDIGGSVENDIDDGLPGIGAELLRWRDEVSRSVIDDDARQS